MDGIFNSPFMVKLQEFGQKLGSNKFLSALQGSMMSCMAPIMVGAIFSIICAVGPMFGIFQNGDAVYSVLYMPYHFTMDLLSLWIVLIPLYALEVIISTCTGGAMGICSGFMAILSAPLNALTSVPGMFVLCGFAALLWCFGIHGTMVLMSVILPMGMQAATANAAAYAAGGYDALVFYPIALFAGMANCGGTGNTLPLVIFGLKAKSEQIKAVSKIALIPGWFGINEPVTFGMPIMYNPILCIPYVLNIFVVMLCTLIGYKVGFLVPAFVPIMTLMPMGFGSFLGTLRWQNAIWDYLMLIPAGLVWYPFFKVYDNQLYKQEQEALAAEAE